MLTAAFIVLSLSQAPEAEPRALLDKAEQRARDGRYAEARSTYKQLADRYPATEAGQIAVRRSRPSAFLGWDFVVEHGPPANRVDVVIMGDGYELEHVKAFDKLATDVPPLFERVEPFREYWSYFNFVRASLVSADNGVDGFGRVYDTALNAHTADTFAGHVSIDDERVHAMLDELPDHDGLAICFVRNGVAGTGGSGYAAIGGRDASTTIHEWGHAFAGLGDEYDAQQAAHVGSVNDCPNVSSTADPKKVPWAHWIAAKHASVGVYEGAAGRVRGAWKPTSAGCIMASEERFCPVCREAVVLRIYSLVDPIDACTPAPPASGNEAPMRVGEQKLEFRVRVLRPASHTLEVRWWVLTEEYSAPPKTRGLTGAGSTTERTPVDRRLRGRLAEIAAKPVHVSRNDADGEHVFEVKQNDYAPGRYWVVCRARDTTEIPGERWPLVLRDEFGVLESERAWPIEIPAR